MAKIIIHAEKATPKQIKYIKLLEERNFGESSFDEDLEDLTKDEASQIIKSLESYGG